MILWRHYKTFGIPKKQEKDEKQFSRRINGTFSRCCNEFPSEEVVNMYIEEPTLPINSLLQQFHDIH